MKRDEVDDLADELLGAARMEAPSEEARLRTLSALRHVQPQADLPSRSRWPVMVGMGVAAAALLTLYLGAEDGRPIGIAAEDLEPSNDETPVDEQRTEEQRVHSPSTAKDAVQEHKRPRAVSPTISDSSAPPQAPPSPPVTLERELERIQHARSSLNSGNAARALSQIDDFARSPGWRKLSVEASLIRIEALAQVGRRDEARRLAQRFIAEHPNNPLVDRARHLAADATVKTEEPDEREEN